MPTKKTLKKTSNNSKKQLATKKSSNYCGLSILLGAFLCLSLVLNFCLYKNQKSYEEEKRLQAFETLANAYIDELSMYAEESRDGKTATLTGIGVTDDKDLYLDFTITNYTDHVPISFHDGRLHFQCNNRSGKVIGDTPEDCAMAYWYGEETETPLEFQERYKNYIEELESITNFCNETVGEDGTSSADCASKREALNEKYADFFEEIRAFHEAHK